MSHAQRRHFLIAAGAFLTAPLKPAWAQRPGKMYQIGYVGNSTPSAESALVAGFRQGLRERGYTEGKDIVIHYRWAAGKNDLVSEIIAEFVELKLDVIVTSGTLAPLVAKKATTVIPVVMAASGDPVGSGIVASLSRPGGNITGLSTVYADLEGKRLEILRELVPKLTRLALLANPAQPFTPITLKATRAAAERMRISIEVHEVRAVDEFEDAFAAIAKSRPDAMAVLADRPFFFANRTQIVRLAARHQLPAIYPFLEFVEEGGLVYFGPNFVDLFRRAGTYIDKILKGARPGDLPIEEPTALELVMNLKTAQALGISIPPSIRLRVDRMIE